MLDSDVEQLPRFPVRSIVSSVICLLGTAVASYLTLVHFDTSVTLTCPAAGKVINCEKVTTSAQSYVFHIPVALLGLCFFVPMLVICLPWVWREARGRYIAPLRLVASVTGIGFVCYLLYAELYEIHAICLWCTSVHILTFLLFATIVTGWDDATAASTPRSVEARAEESIGRYFGQSGRTTIPSLY